MYVVRPLLVTGSLWTNRFDYIWSLVPVLNKLNKFKFFDGGLLGCEAVCTNVSEESIACIFRADNLKPKRRHSTTNPQGITTQETIIDVFLAVKISNPIQA
jgi:hypothetical protein